MGFMEAYKHLEKLCEEILNNNRSVSAYIEEMERTPNAEMYVKSWNCDYKALKRYRWIRNKISHDYLCTEENMCEPEDELWLNQFYDRIMNQTDPLSLYRNAILNATIDQPKNPSIKERVSNSPHRAVSCKCGKGNNQRQEKKMRGIVKIIGTLICAGIFAMLILLLLEFLDLLVLR